MGFVAQRSQILCAKVLLLCKTAKFCSEKHAFQHIARAFWQEFANRKNRGVGAVVRGQKRKK